MAEPPPAIQEKPVSNGTKSASQYELDITKLHALPSDQQGLYLLSFTADLARHVDTLDGDGASAEQVPIKKELIQIMGLTSPLPSRVIRENIGRCFDGLLRKGSRKILYETINELVAILQGGKDRDLRTKHAAVSCLGIVFEAAGDSAASLSPLACNAALRCLKPAANDTGFRSAIYRSLAHITVGIKVAIDEDIGRSIWKAARNAAGGDKSSLVLTSACECLEQLFRCTSYFDNSNDFEKLQTSLWRSFESSSPRVRHSAASCLAAVLVKSFSETGSKDAVPRVRKPRKAKKTAKGEDLDDDMERASSPAPEKPATALSYSLIEMLKILSVHFSRSINPKSRAGIAVCYIKVLRSLGERIVKQNFSDIARHFFVDVLSHPSLIFNKYRQLMSRRFVRIILERVVVRMIGETAQLNACRFLLNDIIKDYPQAVKERPEPSKQTLVGALSTLTTLIGSLDAAVGGIAESIREALLQTLQHPSFTVQIHTACAMRAFVLACPQQLIPTVTICMNSVNRELNLLAGPRQAPKRCIGYAHGLAAVLSTSNQHPLYGSVDVYARVLQQATTLLKSSAGSDLRISSCQLQVAWVMLGGLMSLGPSFVKIHLSQLMLLWKNALPRPVSREHMSQRNMIELSYLSHVRESALGSIKAFLTFNQRLLTQDISRRLSAMLENTVAFLQSLPNKKTSDDPANRLSPALQLQDYEVMVRRRLFECYSQLLVLSPNGSIEPTAHSVILPLAVASFSDADYLGPSSLSAAIASAAAAYESVWDVGDNYGFGVSGLVHGLDVTSPVSRVLSRHWTSRLEEHDEIDWTIQSPIGGAPEFDSTSCYLNGALGENAYTNPAGTEVTNTAICAFGLGLSLQAFSVQDSMLEQIASSITSPLLQKDPARRAAITVNIALALATVCRVATGDVGSTKGEIRSSATEKAVQSLLHTCIRDTDANVRSLAADAIGRLCRSSGNAFTNAEVAYLTDTIVNNREPHVRAGCASALASIHSQLGGMAAGYHLKNIVGVLLSLAADTHPLVHFWALDSIAQVAESAGLNYAGYITQTLGMLTQLHVSDSHNAETAALGSSNMALDLPTTAALARGVDSIINVLGPDLQEIAKARDMILTLVQLFSKERDVLVQLESLRCMEHLSLYAPGHLDFVAYVHRLQTDVDAPSAQLASAALTGLSTIMRRDATDIVRNARPGLEDRLWDCLNNDPIQPAVRDIFMNWLHQTGSSDPADWIQRCNTILTRTKAKFEQPQTAVPKDTAGGQIQDDEVAGFAVGAGVTKDDEDGASTSTQELMRWQVRLFAMQCLHTLISTISKEAAISAESPGEVALQHKVADVVRIAFSASTAGVAELRVVGMRIIDQILRLFGRTVDPDFPEAMLLEQYQAQISSALTPAFATDSSPELAAAAVSVCATFIATGIVTDIERLGRVHKVLVSALNSFAESSESASIGDLRALSNNAQVMVRMAVFSAWAELQIASAEQKYLVEVVKPHIAQLVPLWLSSLREYSRLRFEPDISASLGITLSDDLDTVYAALNRQTLLSFYQQTWLSLVDAIASLIDEDSDIVFDALDGKSEKPTTDESVVNGNGGIIRKQIGIDYREEPVAFFFVLFGLAFESLAIPSNDEGMATRQRNLDILRALGKILRPSVSGNAVYQEVVFAETMELFDRMVLTGSLGEQSLIVEIARNLCIVHPSSRQGLQTPINDDGLSDDIEQLFELTRIIVLVLAGLIPGLAENPVSVRLETSEEAVELVRSSVQALVDVSEVFPSIIKTDLHATVLHIFVTVLGTGACQAAVVPQALPTFRRFISSIVADAHPDTTGQLHNTLSRMLLILKNAQKRETEASLPCEKNTMLMTTVLLTAATECISDEHALVGRFASELCGALEGPKTTRVAASCIRTLLLARVGLKLLIPSVVSFLTHPDDLEGLAESRSLLAPALVSCAVAADPSQRSAFLGLAIYTLLERAAEGGPTTHHETASMLLELAAADNVSFRAVVSSMNGKQKALLEHTLKSRTGPRRVADDQQGHQEPSIALKMDFAM